MDARLVQRPVHQGETRGGPPLHLLHLGFGLDVLRAAAGVGAPLGLRLGATLTTLLGSVTLALFLVSAAPGDVIDLLPNADEVRPVLEIRWGLDRPLAERWLGWVSRALTGDLGTSWALRPGMPVTELLARPALASALRVLGATLTSCVLGMGLALLGLRVRVTPGIQMVSLAPTFLLVHGVVLALNELTFAGMSAGWWARPDWFALPDQASLLRSSLGVVLLAVGSGSLAEVHHELEARLGGLWRSPLLDATRARGQAVAPVLLRQLVPTLAGVAAGRVGVLWGGTVVVEKLMLLPGAGALMWDAALRRDVEVVLGCALLAATVVAVARMAADTLAVIWDPRLRRIP